MYSSTTEYQRTSLTILPTENYNLPFMAHKIPYLSSLLVTCHQSSRLYGVVMKPSSCSTPTCLQFEILRNKNTNKNYKQKVQFSSSLPKKMPFGLCIFILKCNTIFNHTNIRLRTRLWVYRGHILKVIKSFIMNIFRKKSFEIICKKKN